MFKVPEKHRIKTGAFGSDSTYGNNGAFTVPLADGLGKRLGFACIASDGEDWEHVSVSLPNRCPTWSEMVRIKDIFWSPNDLVIQIHPPQSDYVDNHPYCLHLWRKCGTNDYTERPPWHLVGIKKG